MFFLSQVSLCIYIFVLLNSIVFNIELLQVNACPVSSVCTRGITYRGQERGILTCYPDTNLAIAKELMEAKGIKQLPVVKHGRERLKERKRRIVAVLHYDSISQCLRFGGKKKKKKISQFMVLLNDTCISFLTVNLWSLNSVRNLAPSHSSLFLSHITIM